MLRQLSLYIMSLFYVVAGVMHFLKTNFYLKIMPPYLPFPLFLVYISGIAEILLGILILIPTIRVFAAWGVIALLIAVFPANIYMAQKGGAEFGAQDWALYLRLPLQGVLIAWAWVYTRAS